MTQTKGATRPAHLAEMPYAKEPLKTAYVAQRLLTTLLLVPCWALYYTLFPRRRPRASWSIKQVISVKFTRRVFRVTELAGVTWYTRDPEEACRPEELKETRFEWAEPLPEVFRSGILCDEEVPFKRVGVFVWPKTKRGNRGVWCCSGCVSMQLIVCSLGHDIDVEATTRKQPVIGIFLHGGGYCHMSAHEKCGTSKIPRRLIKVRLQS